MSLPESRLYTFIDAPREFALYFLEGQKLIQDLALLSPLRRHGFACFRDVVLSVQPLIALLKHGEQFGFYLDASEPRFRLKIESGHNGATRCMVLPESLAAFPATVSGVVRLLKIFPSRVPYESVLAVDGLPPAEIVNMVLDVSYQAHCVVVVAATSDQSLMLHQLPPSRSESYELSDAAVAERRRGMTREVERLFALGLSAPPEIEAAFSGLGFRLLASRPVSFRCSCSQARMVSSLRLLRRREREELFDPGENELEAVCEYCKARYRVTRAELERAPTPPS